MEGVKSWSLAVEPDMVTSCGITPDTDTYMTSRGAIIMVTRRGIRPDTDTSTSDDDAE